MGASTYFADLGPARPALAQENVRHPSHGWEEVWRVGLSRGMSAPPVLADSLLFVASLDRNVHALSLESPRPRVVWKRNFRGGFEAAPLIDDRLVILAETGTNGRLLGVEPGSRSEAWTVQVGDLIGRPLLDAGTIYAATSTGRVVAVTRSGVERWRVELGTRIVARPVIVDGALVLAATDGRLFALDPAGGEVREQIDGGGGPVWSDPVVLPGESGAVAVYATVGGQILAVRSDLEVVARRSFDSRFFAGPRWENGVLYLAGHEGMVWAYDWESAEVLWRREVAGVLRAVPAVGPRAVTVGDLAGGLHFLDRQTGEPLWRTRLDGAVTASPLAVGALLYVATERGSLYAFRPTSSPSR